MPPVFHLCHLDFPRLVPSQEAQHQTPERRAAGHAGPGRRRGGGQGDHAGAAVDRHQPWRNEQQSVGLALIDGWRIPEKPLG